MNITILWNFPIQESRHDEVRINKPDEESQGQSAADEEEVRVSLGVGLDWSCRDDAQHRTGEAAQEILDPKQGDDLDENQDGQ